MANDINPNHLTKRKFLIDLWPSRTILFGIHWPAQSLSPPNSHLGPLFALVIRKFLTIAWAEAQQADGTLGLAWRDPAQNSKPQREDLKTMLPSWPLLSHCNSIQTAWGSSREDNPAWVTEIGLKLGKTKQWLPWCFHCQPRKPMASRDHPRLNLNHREHVGFHRERRPSTFRGAVTEWTEAWRHTVSV